MWERVGTRLIASHGVGSARDRVGMCLPTQPLRTRYIGSLQWSLLGIKNEASRLRKYLTFLLPLCLQYLILLHAQILFSDLG